MNGNGNLSIGILIVCVAVGMVFLVSLGLPVLYDGNGREMKGAECLLFGWLGFPTYICWFANIALLFWSCLLLTGSFRRARLVSLGGAALAMTSFLLEDYPGLPEEKIAAFGPGFYLWNFSMIAGALTSIVVFNRSKKSLARLDGLNNSGFISRLPSYDSNR